MAVLVRKKGTITAGTGLGAEVHGFYKWDTKPDAPGQPVKYDQKQYNNLMAEANYADSKGLHNIAATFRADAQRLKGN